MMNSFLFLETLVYIFSYALINLLKTFNELFNLINAHIIILHQHCISKKQQESFTKNTDIIADSFIQTAYLQFKLLKTC